MSFPITCTACNKTFTISDEIFEKKVAGRVVTIKCKACGQGIRVDGTKGVPAAAAGTAAAAPPPAPAAPASPAVAAPPPAPSPPAATEEPLWAVDYPDGQDREFTTAEVVAELERGAVEGSTLVWRDGMAEWLEVHQVPELARELSRIEAKKKAAEQAAAAAAAAAAAKAAPVHKPRAPMPTVTGLAGLPGATGQKPRATQPSTPELKPRATQPSTPELTAKPRAAQPSAPDLSKLRPAQPAPVLPKPPGPPPLTPSAAAPSPTPPFAAPSPTPPFAVPPSTATASPTPPFAAPLPFGAPSPPPFAAPPPFTAPTAMPAPPVAMAAPAPPMAAPRPPMAEPAFQPPTPPLPASVANVVSRPPQVPAFPAASPPFAAPFPTAPAIVADHASVEWPEAKSKKPLVIGIVVVLLIAIGGAVFALSGKEPPPPPPAPISALPPSPTNPTPSPPATPDPTPGQTSAAQQQGADTASGSDPVVTQSDTTPGAGFAEMFAAGARKAESKGATVAPTARFDATATKAPLAQAATEAQACKQAGGPTGKVTVVVTFAPNGKVASATITDAPFAGTATGACISSALKRATIAPFSGLPGTVSKTFSIL